ncbi:uncharacterized protein [Dermacentor albipictus]|uniref:uncharacterized protein n=1 Tax=Dermacentor albipictus TaxID=60249 RepID=UPI0031FC13F1
MFKRVKSWYRVSPKREDSDLDEHSRDKYRRKSRAQRKQSQLPSRPASRPSLARGSVAPSRASSLPRAAAKSAPDIAATVAAPEQLEDEQKSVLDGNPNNLDADKLPPPMQYRFYRHLAAANERDRPDAFPGSLAKFFFFMSAAMLTIVLVTVLLLQYFGMVIIATPPEEDTGAPGGDIETEPPVPIYRRATTPGGGALPESVQKAVNPNDPRYTDPHHRTACVFHAGAKGLTVHKRRSSIRFDVSLFPFALCRVALFCCPSLAANLEPGPEHPEQLMRGFVVSAQANRFLRALVMLGDGSSTSEPQFEALLDNLEAGTLDDVVGTWYKERAYTGVVLRWPETSSAASWQRVPKLLAWLKQRLSQLVGLTLGVALRQDAVGPDLTQLAASLGPTSLFLLPPDMPPSKYQGTTISYFSESTLNQLWQLYTRYFMPGAGKSSGLGQSACYLLPADTYTFKVAQVADDTPAPSEQSLGPGVEGNVTGEPGRMAYFESCQLVAAYATLALSFGVVAAKLDSWVSYTQPRLLAAFVERLHDNVSATCVGLWNPQWDDFGALCGSESYPLARAVFRHFNDTH